MNLRRPFIAIAEFTRRRASTMPRPRYTASVISILDSDNSLLGISQAAPKELGRGWDPWPRPYFPAMQTARPSARSDSLSSATNARPLRISGSSASVPNRSRFPKAEA
jgi:hypothetical protein